MPFSGTMCAPLAQFDQKYIGIPLKELLRYGEPDWSVGERQGRDRTDFHDSLDKE